MSASVRPPLGWRPGCRGHEQSVAVLQRRSAAFSAGLIKYIRPGAILVNTARGNLIEEAALFVTLRSGHLSGTGLDVTPREPRPRGSGLWSLDTVVMTPHADGAVAGNFPRVAERALEHVTAVLSGRAMAAEDVAV